MDRLTAGLEIHQQLATKEKLFCHCSTAFEGEPRSFTFSRKLRPVVGEMGELDVAARHEALKKMNFTYRTYPGQDCLLESDSVPAGDLNPEALDIVLEIALLLHCDIVDEVHVMRKGVIDGSNPSGFQRTALIGTDGWITTSKGKVGILAVALEEDSAQILKKEQGRTVYGVNRLGIPLVEIATAPDISTPEHGKEVAEQLGMILRSSRVKRGLGTIRQDLNISIPGGARVEIKGVQDLKSIPRLIEQEVKRQQHVLLKKKHVTNDVRKAQPDGSTTFLRPLPGAARLYPETDCVPIPIPRSLLSSIKKNLPELLQDKHQRLSTEARISQDQLRALEKADKLELFSTLKKKTTVKPVFIAETLISYTKELLRKHTGADPLRITDKDLEKIFKALEKGIIAKDSVMDILKDLAFGKKLNLSSYETKKIDIDSEVRALLKKKPGLSFGAYMGILMSKYKGAIPGDAIAKALKKHVKGHNG